MTPKSPHKQPTIEEFSYFIDGLELRRVRLRESHIQAQEMYPNPNETKVELIENYQPSLIDNGFEAIAEYQVKFCHHETGNEIGSIKVAFAFFYESKSTLNNELLLSCFDIFKSASLPVNAWPFLREFVHNAMSRMDWPPFTLPLFKTNINPSPSKNSEKKNYREKLQKTNI